MTLHQQTGRQTIRQSSHSLGLLLAGCALAALSQPVAAQQWVGGTSDDYLDPANWSNGQVPTNASATVIDTTTNAPVIDAGQTGQARNLAVGEAGTGQLTIREGGDLILGDAANGGFLSIGGSQTTNATGGNGRVTVTGAGSTISGPGGLTLGVGISRDATGLLEVLDGAVLTSNSGSIGTAEGSNGILTVSGAGSQWVIASGAGGIRLGNLNFANARGTLNVLDGATVTYPGGVGWTLGEGATINVSGAGSTLGNDIAITGARGAINVTDGGTVALSQLIGQFGADLTISGANSSLTTGLFLMAQGNDATGGSLLVEAGGQLNTAGFSFASNGVPADFDVTVQGAGSRWTITEGNARNLGAGNNLVDFRVLSGGVVDASNSGAGNWSIGQGASVLISGEGSRVLASGVWNLNATTAGQPVGEFIVENGGELTVNANGLSTLGSIGGPVSRSLIVRSGGEVNFTGGTGAGLSVRGGSILVDAGTLTGRLDLGLGTAGRTTVTVRNGGLIDGTGGGNWFTDAGADFLVTGANSRLIAVGAPTVGGDITVSAGGNASFQAIDFANSARTNSLTISGANSQFSTGDFFVSRFGGQSSDILVENGGRLITGRALLGVNSDTSTVNLTVTGAGSLWQVTSGATALDFGAGASDVNFSILNGGRFQSLSTINPSFRPNTDLLISGAGSTFETAGNISFGGSSLGAPVGTLVIENGGSLITRGPSDNGLGFNGILRTMQITNGSSWIMTGGPNSGLQIETTDLLVDNSTLSAQGSISIGLRFSGTNLILRNADFIAQSLGLGSVAGNKVIIGTRADGSAGAAGLFDVGSVSLTSGNTLEINHTQSDFTIASTITGAGSINHRAGTTRFTGGQAGYSGLLTATGGSVIIDGALGGSGARATFENARLSGIGSFGGDVTLANATLAPGNSAGTFTIGGDLVLGAASVLEFELGAPDLAPGNGSDLIGVAGDLTLDGTLNITNIGGFGSGLYRLINYGGTLTNNGLEFGAVPTGFEATGLMLDLATTGQVNLLATAAEPDFDFIFWDGAATSANGLIGGGSGTWSVTGTNWTTLDGDNNGVFDPADFLIFRAPETNIKAGVLTTAAATPSASTGMVTVDNGAGQVSLANGAQFAATGYTVTGGAIRLDAPGATVRVGDGSTGGGAFVATIASALTGAGGLTKTDLGTLILSGANTYSGGTQVQGGTLQGDTTSLQRNIAISAPGTLLFNQSANGTFAGVLSGAGAFAKEGSGVLTLSGNSANFLGRADLFAGSLNITGTLGQELGNSLLSSAAGTTLTGNGRVGNLVLAGTIAPGAGSVPAAAVFNVDGDVTFAAGSTYRVDLAASGAGDRIVAGDDVVINGGTVAINLLDPELNYVGGTIFTIAQASESLTGTFAGLTETSAFLDFALGYAGTSAFLTLDLVRQFPDVALTVNQRQASTGLMELDRSSGSDSLAVYNAILLLEEDAARTAFDLASGEIYANVLASAQRSALAASAANHRRASEPGKAGWDAWIEGGLGRGRVSADGNGARFTQDKERLSLGLDYHGRDDGWAIGIGGGWLSGDIENSARLSTAQLDGWHMGGFARFGNFGKGLTASVTASHATADGSAARTIRFGTINRTTSASVETRTTALTADLRFGLVGEKWVIGPVAGIEYSHSKLSSFTESGAGALDLSSDGTRDKWTRASVGAFVSHRSDTARLLLDLRYMAGERDDSLVQMTLAGSPQDFTVLPARGSKSGFKGTANGEVGLGGGWSLGGTLDTLMAGDERALSGSATIRLEF